MKRSRLKSDSTTLAAIKADSLGQALAPQKPAKSKAAKRDKAAKADGGKISLKKTKIKTKVKASAAGAKAGKIADASKARDKLIRDSFTLPREDFDLIAVLKERALGFKRPTKKSELLRAGLQLLARLDSAALQSALDALRPLKAGRPKKKH
ncbi:hypothetical protein DFR29_10932 [Tahibacter aquaticus]|uniref:Uncharacterized protein n=1 Tax=Tahibacter aquaticus TaxID=520092 RepID=A0A4R6YTZ8_9GAMM|nr:hypothetical protein [Tahibacter aquaticus]TDR41976.1 hypothetical protein DFR29_10932 [Tahibacter aquaticus]